MNNEEMELLIAPFGTIALEITNEKELGEAGELLFQLSKVSRDIEDKRKNITEPLNKSLKEINNFFRPYADKLENARGVIKLALIGYEDVMDLKRKEALLLGGTEAILALSELETIKQSTFSMRTVKEVIINDLTLVPQDYYIIDMPRLKKDVLSGVVVPGTEIVEKKQIAA